MLWRAESLNLYWAFWAYPESCWFSYVNLLILSFNPPTDRPTPSASPSLCCKFLNYLSLTSSCLLKSAVYAVSFCKVTDEVLSPSWALWFYSAKYLLSWVNFVILVSNYLLVPFTLSNSESLPLRFLFSVANFSLSITDLFNLTSTSWSLLCKWSTPLLESSTYLLLTLSNSYWILESCPVKFCAYSVFPFKRWFNLSTSWLNITILFWYSTICFYWILALPSLLWKSWFYLNKASFSSLTILNFRESYLISTVILFVSESVFLNLLISSLFSAFLAWSCLLRASSCCPTELSLESDSVILLSSSDWFPVLNESSWILTLRPLSLPLKSSDYLFFPSRVYLSLLISTSKLLLYDWNLFVTYLISLSNNDFLWLSIWPLKS